MSIKKLMGYRITCDSCGRMGVEEKSILRPNKRKFIASRRSWGWKIHKSGKVVCYQCASKKGE